LGGEVNLLGGGAPFRTPAGSDYTKNFVYFFLASAGVAQIGYNSSEDSSPVNAFGIGLSADPSPKHK
jgi:hypothetical protein